MLERRANRHSHGHAVVGRITIAGLKGRLHSQHPRKTSSRGSIREHSTPRDSSTTAKPRHSHVASRSHADLPMSRQASFLSHYTARILRAQILDRPFLAARAQPVTPLPLTRIVPWLPTARHAPQVKLVMPRRTSAVPGKLPRQVASPSPSPLAKIVPISSAAGSPCRKVRKCPRGSRAGTAGHVGRWSPCALVDYRSLALHLSTSQRHRSGGTP
jgi:hypothetical protein